MFQKLAGWKRAKRKKKNSSTEQDPRQHGSDQLVSNIVPTSITDTLQGSSSRAPILSTEPRNQSEHPISDRSIGNQPSSVPSPSSIPQPIQDNAPPGSSAAPARTPVERFSTPNNLIHSATRSVSQIGREPVLPPPLPPNAISQGILEGAKDFKIENSVLTNVHGNAVIFKFDAGSSPNEEFKSVFINYMAGSITVKDLDKIEKRTLSQAIRDLPRAKAAYDDYVTRDRRRVACFEATRQALLEEIAQCIAGSEGPRTYLLFGIAGVGKSTVAQTVAERADDLHLLGASFFFSRDEADRRNAEKFFTTIAFQLCVYDAHFAQAIGTALTEEQGASATSKDPQRQLKALILEPLQAIAKSRLLPTVIVVDALDECDVDDGPVVLMALDQLVRELPFFKVVLTTRPQPHLQYLLDRLGAHQFLRMEDIEKKVVESDIRLYLEYSLSQDQVNTRLPTLRRKWAANDEEIHSLVIAAGLLFIIASTAVLFILDPAARNPASRMKTLREEFTQNRTSFNTLNNFYTVILRNAVPLGCEHDIVERYQAVIGTIVLIEEPLSVGTLARLIDIPEDDVYAALENLQSVISLGSNDIPLIYHKSFPDYITDGQRCQATDLHIASGEHHTRLAASCLHVMNIYLKRNILGLTTISQYLSNDKAIEEDKLLDDYVQGAIPPELQYASVHWANHLAQADLEDSHLKTELEAFVKERLLYWFEALSWIHKLDTAHNLLGIVLKLRAFNPHIRQIISDALRFVSRCYEKIKENALYIYHSALPFTPTATLLYQTYQHQTLLCQVEGAPAQWDIIVARKKHGQKEVLHIAFAKDNSKFASWDDDSVKLWDGPSGIPIRSFSGRRIALADDFSILAVPQDNSVTMCSASSGTPIASFDHPSTVVQVAISFDGSRLAAGLCGGKIHVWDVEKRVLIGNIDDYNDGPLVFSPHGDVLAFTLKDDIGLWNGANVAARLEHNSEKPVRIVFSVGSARLATVTESDGAHSLRNWNSKNGEFIAVARDVGDVLAISADGSLVATGGSEKAVQLWNGDDLTLVNSLDMEWVRSLVFWDSTLAIVLAWPGGAVTLYDAKNGGFIATLQIGDPTSLAFSPDGSLLVAGSDDGEVYLWDVSSTSALASAPKEELNSVTALTFSLDTSRLASGRRNGSVELWDTSHMRKPISHHKPHSGTIAALAFSPDDNHLASGSTDKTVRFWNGKNDSQVEILEYQFRHELTCLAFSSNLLAAATKDVITLWDRAPLHLTRTIDRGSDSLSFSLDGSALISTDSDKITVWATESFEVAATFSDDGVRTTFLPSPDRSGFAAQDLRSGFKLFSIVNSVVSSDVERKCLSCVPRLNGVPISWNHNPDHGFRLVGWVSTRQCVPVLWIPQDSYLRCHAGLLTMFAFGCVDGRVVLIRLPSS